MRERSIIGGYRIVQKIGSGGMSTVYKAIDAEGRAVALKLLHPELAADPRSRARLRREVAMLQRVRGPYVAQILDAETEDDEVFIVTELIDGPTLDQDVRDSGPYVGSDLVELGEELAAALTSIHDMGILHRDLKPSNVMMGENGPVLIDFGIAQLGDDLRMTQTGSLTHTPGFCDPVVIRGAAPDDEGDWWALAAVLAFAATGRPPFGVGNSPAVMHRVLEGEADLAGLAGDVEQAFRSALAPRREDRINYAELLGVLSGDHDAVVPVPLDPTIRAVPGDVVGPAALAAGNASTAGADVTEPDVAGERAGSDSATARISYESIPATGEATVPYPVPGQGVEEPPSYDPPTAEPAVTRTSIFERPELTAPPIGEMDGRPGSEQSLVAAPAAGEGALRGPFTPHMPIERLPAWAAPPRKARLQVFAVSVVVGIFALAWPVAAAFVFAAMVVVLSWLGGAQRDLRERRMRNGGPYENDVAGAVLRSPLTLLVALGRSAASLAVGALIGLAMVGSLSFFTTLPVSTIEVVGVYVAMVFAWLMGTNSNGREGARYLMEGIAPTPGYRLFWFAITLVVAMAAVVLVSGAGALIV